MVVSASMPVIVADDPVYGGRGYAPIHPGPNPKVLRWGFYDEEVERDLCWMRDDFGPALGETVHAAGGIDLVTVLAKTAGMGDENHNRQPAARCGTRRSAGCCRSWPRTTASSCIP